LEGSKTVLVPDIKQRLFDPVSKVVLQPGTQLRQPTVNHEWLILKHKEAINDFDDVDAEEKEYAMVWDQFMIDKRISSDVFLPRAWLEFVKDMSPWLADAQWRMNEFAKHLSYLLSRDALDDKTAQEGFKLIGEARKRRADDGADGEPAPRLPPKGLLPTRKSASGCTICGLPVLGHRLLICTNTVSSDVIERLTHDYLANFY
jgi:hypothetical protein